MNAEQPRPEEAPVVHRLLVGLVGGVCRAPRLVLAVSLALAAVSLGLFCTHLDYRTQRSDLVSESKASQQRWRKYLAEFGDDDDMVVVVRGADRSRMQNALESLAECVRRQPGSFARLFYKVDLRPLRNRALMLLPEEQIAVIRANLQSMSALLELGPVGWQWLSLGGLLGEAGLRADNLAPGSPLGPADEQFLTQLTAICAAAVATLDGPDRYRNPWRSLVPAQPERQDLLAEPQYFFSGDGALAFLLVQPVKEAGSFTAAQKSVNALHAVVDELRPAYPDLEFGLTGLPVLENDEMVSSQRDTNLVSWLALTGVALLYFVVFRGFRYPLLTVGTLLVGTAWAMGWLTLTVGHLNILSATFAVMLIGMGDYGVLWVTRYEQNRTAGADVRTALLKTAAGGGPSILTAATATALAFFAAMLADFHAVTELGWIAGSGVLLCAFACFTVLPALLTLVDRRAAVAADRPRFVLPLVRPGARSWLPALAARPRWVLAVGGLVTAGLGVCAGRVAYDHNLLHMQARDLDSVRWELTLIEHTAGASWHALSYTDTAGAALALKERYEQLPGVSRVVEVASLVPPGQERKLEPLCDIQHRLRNLPKRGTSVASVSGPAGYQLGTGGPNVDRLKTELEVALQKLARMGAESAGTPGQARAQLLALRQQLDDVPAEQAAVRVCAFEERLRGDLAEDLHQLRDVSTPAPITLADLPPELKDRYVGKTGKWLLQVFGKGSLWEYPALAGFVNEVRTVDPEATGKPFGTLEGLRDLKHGFEWAGLYAFLAIVLVFLADFRSVRDTLLALVPLGMGVLICLGIMGLCGLPLNPANMIGFPLVIGVGAVYGVHVVHDYRACRGVQPYALSYLIGRAILVMALTNIISFGALVISRHVGLAGLGLVLALGVACCMLTALVFLPAVLRLWGERRRSEAVAERERRAA